jgi:PilZ domain-containing protein
MRCALPEQRRYFRVHLPIRAQAIFRDFGSEPQPAFLRDINMLGAFFYCKQRPSVGHTTRLEFAFPEQGEQVTATCEGRVVRVEDSGPGAVGVAIEFIRYELERPVKQEQAGQSRQSTPFIGWTVEMVERMFERSSESTRPEDTGDQEAGGAQNVRCRAPQ